MNNYSYKNLIVSGKHDVLFTQLLKEYGSNLQIYLLKSRLNEIKKQKNRGTIKNDDYLRELNKINESILCFLDSPKRYFLNFKYLVIGTIIIIISIATFLYVNYQAKLISNELFGQIILQNGEYLRNASFQIFNGNGKNISEGKPLLIDSEGFYMIFLKRNIRYGDYLIIYSEDCLGKKVKIKFEKETQTFLKDSLRHFKHVVNC